MKKFTINNQTYIAKPFDFNLVCDLEDMGIQLTQVGTKATSLIRAYFGVCSGLDKDSAGSELQEHVLNGGTFEEISEVIRHELDNSDFFRKLNENQETETPEDAEEQTEKGKKTTKA